MMTNESSDAALRHKIDLIFNIYDQNKTGTLSLNELHVFLNDLLATSGYSRRVSYQEAYNIMKTIDKNKDGQVNKFELFSCFKYLTQPNTLGMGGLNGGGNYGVTGYGTNAPMGNCSPMGGMQTNGSFQPTYFGIPNGGMGPGTMGQLGPNLLGWMEGGMRPPGQMGALSPRGNGAGFGRPGY